jgi:CelD/BcsL family acetyltransferase involved in cellulose biosynthesis
LLVRTTVVLPAELGAAEQAIWRSFQQAQPGLGSPFLAPEMTAAAGKVRPGTRVAVLEDAGQIIGFFPFERRAFGYGTPVAPGLTDCQGLVHAPDAGWDAHDLLRSCGLGVWVFDHLVDGQKPFEPYQVLRAPAPVIDLSSGSAAVLADLRRRSARVVKNLARRQRRLERDIGPLRFEFESRDPAALRMLMAWKSAQYRRTGRTDRFARPWIRQFVSDMLDLHSPHFALVLSVLYAGDQPVAALLAPRRGGVLADWFPAFDPGFASYSPGLLHRLHLIEAAAASGVRLIEMGRRTYEHKDLFKTGDVMVGEGRVVRRSGGAALYYTGRAPLRRLRQTVMDSPPLYRAADAVLTRYGRLHSALTFRTAHRPQRDPS